MSAYRFCRTDDIGLLVDALNRCWAPHFPDEPRTTPESFKRSIRDLQVWCSSCMVAFAGSDPIGVLIGAKRATETLIYRIAVHPDYLRQGHARHMLTSLSSKLAILGPPRIVAEIPTTQQPAGGLFAAAGYDQDAMLTDYVIEVRERASRPTRGHDRLVIPVTLDDLTANGLLDELPAQLCWERSRDTLTARKHEFSGLAIVSDERIEAFVLYTPSGEIAALHSNVDDGGDRIEYLLTSLHALGTDALRLPKAHPAEFSAVPLVGLGFRVAGEYLRCTATPRAD